MGLECNCRMESRVVCTIKTGEWVAVAHLFVAASQRNKQKGHAAKMPENPHILQAGRDRDLGFGMRWWMRMRSNYSHFACRASNFPNVFVAICLVDSAGGSWQKWKMNL